MSKSEEKNKSLLSLAPQDVADALNEQGFLLQQKIRETIRDGIDYAKQGEIPWKVVAQEYPVTAADGEHTRIDLLLNHTVARNVFMCLECKRPNPRYKSWLFFDRNHARPALEHRKFQSGTGSLEPTYKREMAQAVDANVPNFNYYLEVGLKRNGERVSNTEVIETTLRQVMRAHSGMMKKMGDYDETNARSFCRSIPVIVTTAQLYEAEFDPAHILLDSGMINSSAVKLIAHNFCAIDYHPDDSLSIRREDSNYIKGDPLSDMSFYQTRTVFIVHSSSINSFLIWAGERLTAHP